MATDSTDWTDEVLSAIAELRREVGMLRTELAQVREDVRPIRKRRTMSTSERRRMA